MVYCIGLTGNIASGKTTVARMFAQLGVSVLSADEVSRQLMQKDTPAYKEIILRFGSEVLNPLGDLNRRRLREIIFSQPEEKIWLEQLLHPMIRQQLAQQVALCTTRYCIVEIPLSIDKKNYPYINRILLVTCPQDVQIKRIIARDHCTEPQALAIIKAQPSLNQRLENADDYLLNDAGPQELQKKVKQLHIKYLQIINSLAF